MSAAIKVGCDPELFSHENRLYVPVHDWLKGSKKEPFKVEGGAFQVDGMAAEFNIDPASTAAEFDDNVRGVLGQLLAEARKAGRKLSASPVAKFTSAIWQNTPEEYKVLGCDPDYGLDGQPLFNKETEKRLNDSRMRTGSGHIHIGWGDNIVITPDHLADCRGVATIFEEVWGKVTSGITSEITGRIDIIRSNYYGQTGAHRPKPYGVELRKPSNNWLNFRDDKGTYQWVFNVVYDMMDKYMNESDISKALIVKMPTLRYKNLG